MAHLRFLRSYGTFRQGQVVRFDDPVDVDYLTSKGFAEETDEPAGRARKDHSQEPPAKNASTEAWREYAASRHLDIPDDASRDDIIRIVEGAPTGPETVHPTTTEVPEQ